MEAQIAKLADEDERYGILKETIMNKVGQLPLTVNIVERQEEWIDKVQTDYFWSVATDDDLDEMCARLAPLMKFRDSQQNVEKKLAIQDLLTVKETIEFGPDHERMVVDKYRREVEKFIRELVKTNPVIQKIAWARI